MMLNKCYNLVVQSRLELPMPVEFLGLPKAITQYRKRCEKTALSTNTNNNRINKSYK